MNMTDMIQEAQEICEKARASVATEDCMDAAYKLCDLQILLVRMEYEAGWDPVVRAVEEMAPKTPVRMPGAGYVYTGQDTTSVKENLNSIPVVCPSPAEMMHEGGYVEPRQATVSEPRFDNMPNPTPTVTQDPAQTHIDAPEEWGDREAVVPASDLNITPAVNEEIAEAPELNGQVSEPTITDLRDDEPAHTPDVTAGSRFTLGGILGRH